MFRAILLSVFLACPAAADCLTSANLQDGINFQRKDGTTGHIQTKGRNLMVDYVTNKERWYDKRLVVAGVFETEFTAWLSDDMLVGSTVPDYAWRFRPKPVALLAGKSWTGAIREVESSSVFGDQMVEYPSSRGSQITATYTALTEIQAKLSGCTYRILPIEATFTQSDGTHSRRWIYFPDLGFGLETVRDGVKNGLVALTAS